MTLNGKRIVVLGGSSGIGLAIAQAASHEGAAVVIVSSNQARVDLHNRRALRGGSAGFEAEAVVAGLDDVAMIGEATTCEALRHQPSVIAYRRSTGRSNYPRFWVVSYRSEQFQQLVSAKKVQLVYRQDSHRFLHSL